MATFHWIYISTVLTVYITNKLPKNLTVEIYPPHPPPPQQISGPFCGLKNNFLGNNNIETLRTLKINLKGNAAAHKFFREWGMVNVIQIGIIFFYFCKIKTDSRSKLILRGLQVGGGCNLRLGVVNWAVSKLRTPMSVNI